MIQKFKHWNFIECDGFNHIFELKSGSKEQLIIGFQNVIEDEKDFEGLGENFKLEIGYQDNDDGWQILFSINHKLNKNSISDDDTLSEHPFKLNRVQRNEVFDLLSFVRDRLMISISKYYIKSICKRFNVSQKNLMEAWKESIIEEVNE